MKPATELPWKNQGRVIYGGAENDLIAKVSSWNDISISNADTAYIVAAANAYPKLVEALQQVVFRYENVRAAEGYPDTQSRSTKDARNLLRELGEEA